MVSHGCISTAVLQHFFHTQCHLSNQRFTNCICYQHALDLIIPCWDFPVSAQEDREQSKSREKKCQFQAWSWRRIRAHSSALVVLINASTPNLSLSLSLNSTAELEGLHFSFMLSTKENKKNNVQLSYLENEVF